MTSGQPRVAVCAANAAAGKTKAIAGKSLKEICDVATRSVAPNTKGVWGEIAKGAIEPVVNKISDGIGALWTRHVEKDKLAIETKKAQLEAARWPEFGDIAAR